MPDVKLSIVNYGFNLRSSVPLEAQKEDNELLKSARLIIDKHNFGKGAVIISEAFHTDLTNFNNYHYLSDGMSNHIKSFYEPFNTPFLTYHDTMSKPLGVNINAKYIKRPVETSRGVASGYGKIVTFIPEKSNFDNEKTIDLIQQRRFMSLSIGSKTTRENMRCSICGKSIFDDNCEHVPGKRYEDALCDIRIYKPRFSEYSAVMGDPADIDALIRRMDIYDNENHQEKLEDHRVDFTTDPWFVTIYDGISNTTFSSVEIPDLTTQQTTEEESQTNAQEGQMDENKDLVTIISSYEGRILALTKEKEVLSSALINANNTINELSARIETLTSESTETETQTDTSSEENNENSNQTDTSDTIDNEENSEAPATDDNSETGSETEPGTEGQENAETEDIEPQTDSEETANEDQSSEETLTDGELSQQNAEEDDFDNILRSHRDKLMTGSRQRVSVESQSYRMSALLNIEN